MSDNYNLWDEVRKFQNGKTSDFGGIVMALRERWGRMKIINPKENEYKPKKEKSIIQKQVNNKDIRNLNKSYKCEYKKLYEINNTNKLFNLQNNKKHIK